VHFEFLVLESAQAGLSWWTILRKRDGYRRAFADFDANKVARFTSRTVERLMQDASIVRNRQKIEAAIANARGFLEIQQEFGSFDTYVWQFVGGAPIVNRWRKQSDVPPTSRESDALSKDLKTRGFKFVGSTIIYAHMQATGLVNDHLVSCFRYGDSSTGRR
jgi:DNA-3-methyladenine glycosylase I